MDWINIVAIVVGVIGVLVAARTCVSIYMLNKNRREYNFIRLALMETLAAGHPDTRESYLELIREHGGYPKDPSLAGSDDSSDYVFFPYWHYQLLY